MKKMLAMITLLCLLCIHVSAPCLAFEELSKGSKGDAVVEIQNRLNELGYSVGKPDGDFGKKTETAIKEYQGDYGLEVTGIVDELTYSRLFGIEDYTNENVQIKPQEDDLFLIYNSIPSSLYDKGSLFIDLCGCQNSIGKIIIPIEYTNISLPPHYSKYYGKDIIVASNSEVENEDGKHRMDVYDTFGTKLDSFSFTSSFNEMQDGSFAFKQYSYTNDIFECVDKNGRVIVNLAKYNNWVFSSIGDIRVSKFKEGNRYYGLIDIKGKTIIPCKWKELRIQSSRFITVCDDNDMWGCMNGNGKTITPCKWEKIQNYNEGIAAVCNESGLWGYINEYGEQIIECKYKTAECFSEGLAYVDNDTFSGYINRNDEIIIDGTGLFKEGHSFSHGFAAVSFNDDKDKYYSVITRSGEKTPLNVLINTWSSSLSDFCTGQCVNGLFPSLDVDGYSRIYVDIDGKPVLNAGISTNEYYNTTDINAVERVDMLEEAKTKETRAKLFAEMIEAFSAAEIGKIDANKDGEVTEDELYIKK